MSHRLKKKKRKKKYPYLFSLTCTIFFSCPLEWSFSLSLSLSLVACTLFSFRGCLSKHVSFSLINKKNPSICFLYILWLLLFLLQIGTFNLGWEGHHLGLSVVTWPGPTTESTLLPKKKRSFVNSRGVWFIFSNNYFQFLNNILRISTHYFTHTYFYKCF